MIEEWRKFPHNERYGVSSLGRISGIRVNILNPTKDNNGYPSVKIQGKGYKVHKIVALTFIGDSNGLCVNHKNGIKSDNRASNLEYVSYSENTIHAISSGLMNHKKGDFLSFSKLTTENVIEIKSMFSSLSDAEISKHFPVARTTISSIRHGRSWKHV